MLTQKQTTLYWRTWASICKTQGWKTGDNARRYNVHQHCGCPHSMRKFNNRDLSKFLSETAPLRDEVDIRDRDRENALHTIAKDASTAEFSDAYLRRICSDMYGTEDHTSLPMRQLENFRNLIHNRAKEAAPF